MSRINHIVAPTLLVLFSVATTVLALDFQPGKWQITSKVEMPGMPVSMPPMTVTQCMTDQEPVPAKSAQGQAPHIGGLQPEGMLPSFQEICLRRSLQLHLVARTHTRWLWQIRM